MARGKKNQDLGGGVDPLSFVDLFEALGRGAPKEPDDPLRRHGPILFGRCAEWAVEYHRQALRQGTVADFRARALNLVERALAEECFHSGVRLTLEALRTNGDVDPAVYAARMASLQLSYEATWRDAASLCASMMREIEKVKSRKGLRGRPEGARNGDMLAGLFDAKILNDAVRMVPPMSFTDREFDSRRHPERCPGVPSARTTPPPGSVRSGKR